jgi:hypothetical protein
VLAPSTQPGRFEEFRQRVLAAPAALERLRQTDGIEEFVATTIKEAREMGISLTQEEVHAALRTARRDCIERWVP